MLRFLTAGESHGPGLVTVVDGVPAGLAVDVEVINRELRRRQAGYGRGRRMQIEFDQVELLGGVRLGVSLGSPIAMHLTNRDHPSWKHAMSPYPAERTGQAAGGQEKTATDWRARPVTRPRPGHADLAGGLKYGFTDLRNVLERASARETAARVAAGTVARMICRAVGVSIVGHVVAIGDVSVPSDRFPAEEMGARWIGVGELAEASPVRCADEATSREMVEAIDVASRRGDTLGGIFEVAALGVPPGLGSYAQWDRRLDGKLAAAFMSIPGVKGVEIGCGFGGARRPGSDVHDAIAYGAVPQGQWAPRDEAPWYHRTSNRAGGVEGGVSTGQPVVVRAAMKPLSTLMHPVASVDMGSHEKVEAAVERSDVCSVPSAVVVGEAMMAWVIAEATLEKFGADTVDELTRALSGYREQLAAR